MLREDHRSSAGEVPGANASRAALHAKIAHAEALLRRAIQHDHAGRIALVSSFGADSIVLLDMVARINPATPVLLNETGMLFRETLDYQREVTSLLMLSNVRLIRPTVRDLRFTDPDGTLHTRSPDICCSLRKVQPLKRALVPFSAWITGRKRHQSARRAALPFAEQDEALRVKLNPLADWDAQDLSDYIALRALPRHPMAARGYPSIGCAPCTSAVGSGEDARAGRWRGSGKDECGIHFVDGQLMRGNGEGI